MTGSISVLLCFVQIHWIWPVLAISQETERIRVTKCCTGHQLYMTELDICRQSTHMNDWNPTNQSHSQLVNGPSIQISGRSAKLRSLDDPTFEKHYELQQCAKGFVGMSSPEFQFDADGLLYSPTEETHYNPGSFCIQESYPTGQYVARYCVKDPCSFASICIRKCCPKHTAFDLSTTSCANVTKEWTVVIYNQTGNPVDLHSEMYVERDGVLPKCPSGFTLKLRERDCYRLRSPGWLNLFSSNSKCSVSHEISDDTLIEDYCVDNFIINDTVNDSFHIESSNQLNVLLFVFS